MQGDEDRPLATEIGHQKLEEGIDDKCLCIRIMISSVIGLHRGRRYLVEISDCIDEESRFQREESNQRRDGVQRDPKVRVS